MGNVPTKEARPSNGSATYSRRHRSASAPSKPLGRQYNDESGSSSSPGSSSKDKKGSVSETRESKVTVLETVDGGFLIPQGVYSGPQDYKHQVVRHLMIERHLAPFYKGLADYNELWTDNQLIAALCGINPSSVIVEESETDVRSEAQAAADVVATSSSVNPRDSHESHESHDSRESCSSHQTSATSINEGEGDSTLVAPESPQSMPSAPTTNASYISSNPHNPFRRSTCLAASAADSPSSGASSVLTGNLDSRAGSADTMQSQASPLGAPFDPQTSLGGPRSKESLQGKSSKDSIKASSSSAHPFIASVYRGAVECPICFLYYPAYINKTKCCMQPICSECFVQIKRADPHLPYHNTGDDGSSSPGSACADSDSQLISEPATCPYCAQPDFAVTYIPGDTRSGLMPTMAPGLHHRQYLAELGSFSAKSSPPMVVSTDLVRPDWQAKLDKARESRAKKAANAAALHASNLILAPGESSSSRDQRSRRPRGTSSHSRSARNRSGSMASSSSHRHHSSSQSDQQEGSDRRHRSRRFTTAGSTATDQQPRLSEIEDMMIVEAIRRSLQTVEDERARQQKAPSVRSAAVILPPGSSRTLAAGATGSASASSRGM